MSDKKTIIRSIIGRLFRWGKKHIEEEIEAEVQARLARRTAGFEPAAKQQPGTGPTSPPG